MIVNIKYVNFPKPGGKYGSLKTDDGQTIMCPPDLLGLFRSGMTAEVATKQQTWGQGTDQEKLVTIATSGPLQSHTAPVQGQGGPVGYNLPAQGQAPYRSNTGFQPRVVQGGQPARTVDEAKRLFVSNVVGGAIGKCAPSELRVWTQAAIEAFEMLFQPPPRQPVQQLTEPPLGMEPGDPGPELQ